MNKQGLCKYLKDCNINFEIIEHPAIATVKTARELNLPYADTFAKNLFLVDSKKNLYLITLRDNLTVDLKVLRAKIGSGRLGFANEIDFQAILQLKKGAVSPFGLLNDLQHKVQFYYDGYFSNRRIAVHPNDNTATIFLRMSDMLYVLIKNGILTTPIFFD